MAQVNLHLLSGWQLVASALGLGRIWYRMLCWLSDHVTMAATMRGAQQRKEWHRQPKNRAGSQFTHSTFGPSLKRELALWSRVEGLISTAPLAVSQAGAGGGRALCLRCCFGLWSLYCVVARHCCLAIMLSLAGWAEGGNCPLQETRVHEKNLNLFTSCLPRPNLNLLHPPCQPPHPPEAPQQN